MKAQALHGHLDALLLAVLEGGSLHGYAVIEALKAAQRRHAGPAHRHHLPGTAPAGAGRLCRERVGHRQRPGAPDLPADRGRPAGAGRRARRLAGVQRHRGRLPRPGPGRGPGLAG